MRLTGQPRFSERKKEGPKQCLWLRRCCTPAPEGSTARMIAGLDKKLVRKWGRSGADIGEKPKEDVALRPLKPRIAGLGKKLVRQRAPRRQRMNLLEDSKRRGA